LRNTTQIVRLGERDGMRPAVSTPERLEALEAYAASGGKLGLM
jgi:para-nitrobenzyl esterase